jgi:alpha-L-fucosidase
MSSIITLKQISDVIAVGPFRADWDSLAEFVPPAWFRKAKFGIFIHWGLYSVPAFANEWYSRNMYIQGTPEFEHHVKTYGKHTEFGYKDFIPLFTAPKFDPDEWAALFKQAGAQYVVPVAEHHEGFQMYASALSHWNAAEMGPHRDVLGELLLACDNQGIIRALSSHRAEHWWFMGRGKEFESDIHEPLQRGDFYWPSVTPEPNFQDLNYVPTPTAEYLEDWLLRCCELVDNYRPRLIYFDWWIQHSAFKPYLQQFAAYYYNRAYEWGFEATITYKHDAFAFGTAIIDIERGKFAEVKPYPWQVCTAIGKNSWCHVDNLDYKSVETLLCDLIDIVSKNGCMLLNVGPKADGSIPPEDAIRLQAIGKWLSVNGEAIYDTIPWRVAGEGPTKTVEGQFSDGADTVYTSEDIRYTTRGASIYAIVLKPASDGKYTLKNLAEVDARKLPVFHGIIDSVEQLGEQKMPIWSRDESGLHIETIASLQTIPVVFRVRLR